MFPAFSRRAFALLLGFAVMAGSGVAWYARRGAVTGQVVSTKCAQRSLNFNDASQNVTTQYQAQGVTFASGRSTSPVLQWGGDIQSVASPSNKAGSAQSLAVTYFRQGAGGTANPAPTMIITFSPPVDGATLSFYAKTMNDVVGTPGYDTLTVQSFDASNVLIETRTLQTDVQYTNPRTHPTKTYDQLIAEQRVAFTQGKVAKVVLSDAFTTGVAIDDLSFSPAACNDAACNGDTIPATLVAGRPFTAQLNVQNIGTSTWTGNNYYLGYLASNPTPLSAWGLTNGGTVWPGWPSATIAPLAAPYISLTGTAPALPGSYTYRWQMLQNGVEAFGQICGKAITVRAPAENASCAATVPATATAGQTFPVTFVMTNTGDYDWTGSVYALRDTDTASPDWGVTNVALTGAVAMGDSHTFTVNVTAPQAPGSYPLRWAMTKDGAVFGQTCGGDVAVAPPPQANVTMTGGLVPQTVTNRATAQVAVTVRNTGTLAAPQVDLVASGGLGWAIGRAVTGGDGFSCLLSSQDCHIMNLAPGEARTYAITLDIWADVCPATGTQPISFIAVPSGFVDADPSDNKTPDSIYTVMQCPASSSSSSASLLSSSSRSSSSSFMSSSSSSFERGYCCGALTGRCTQGEGCTQTLAQCLIACDLPSSSSRASLVSSSSRMSSLSSAPSSIRSSSVGVVSSATPPSSAARSVSSTLVTFTYSAVSVSSRFSQAPSSSAPNISSLPASSRALSSNVASSVRTCDGFGCRRAGQTVCALQDMRCAETDDAPCFTCLPMPHVRDSSVSSVSVTVSVASSHPSSAVSSDGAPVLHVALEKVVRYCGDGVTDGSETCDAGDANSNRPNAFCRTDCSLARCGDGIVDSAAEQCDDGGVRAGDGCSETCSVERPAPSTLAAQVFDVAKFPHFASPTSSRASMPMAQVISPQTQTWQVLPQATVPMTASSGPAALAVMAAGAASGLAYVRKKRRP